MSNLDEWVFVRALTERSEDARRMMRIFEPDYLRNAALNPVLRMIYSFVKKHQLSPSIKTLRKELEAADSEVYAARYRKTLDRLEALRCDQSEHVYEIELAEKTATVRAFEQLASEQSTLKAMKGFDSTTIIKSLHGFITKFSGARDVRTLSIEAAAKELAVEGGIEAKHYVETGLDPVDEWLKPGLGPGQVGLVVAPTGGGKSVFLLHVAAYAATVENKHVWLITNELTMKEETARLVSRISGVPVSQVKEDGWASTFDDNWERITAHGGGLIISEFQREVSALEIENEMSGFVALTGQKPALIVLDYLERMRPETSGHKREQSWNWIGAICGDLVRLAKRHELALWTAGQVNRSGLGSEQIDLSQIQGSIKHAQEASVVLGLSKAGTVEDDKGEKTIFRIDLLKNRHGRHADAPAFVKADLKKMAIFHEAVKAPVEEALPQEVHADEAGVASLDTEAVFASAFPPGTTGSYFDLQKGIAKRLGISETHRRAYKLSRKFAKEWQAVGRVKIEKLNGRTKITPIAGAVVGSANPDALQGGDDSVSA